MHRVLLVERQSYICRKSFEDVHLLLTRTGLLPGPDMPAVLVTEVKQAETPVESLHHRLFLEAEDLK